MAAETHAHAGVHLTRGGDNTAHRKLTRKLLKQGIDEYFDSHTGTVPVLDAAGEPVMKDGKPMTRETFVIPVSEAELCIHLGISDRTWTRYASDEKTKDITDQAKLRIKAWLIGESCTRDKPQGVIFNLNANYGMKETKEIGIDKETRKDIMERDIPLSAKLTLLKEAAASLPRDK